jgi:anti-sigma B factor antagonist
VPLPTTEPLQLQQVGAVSVVRFRLAEIMHADVIDSVGDRLSALVEDEGRRVLLLDFTAVRKISSSLLGRLVGLHRKLLAIEGRLALCGIDADLQRVFDLCQLPRLLHIYSDQNAALAALAPGQPGESASS